MQKLLITVLVLFVCSELPARAGGGGSYRSSSGSSSHSSSSSSSSSNRSLSSPAYRSYSPSSSSSRAYSGGSSSSHRAPEYRQLPIEKVEAYSAEISLLANGRIAVEETLQFKPFDQNPKHVYYRNLSTWQDTQRIQPGFTVSGDLAPYTDRISQTLSFRANKPEAQLLSAKIHFIAERAYFASENGLWDFHFGLTQATQGSIKIRSLPVGATAWLFDQGFGGKLINKVAGTGGPAILAASAKLRNPRLVIHAAKAPSASVTSTVPRFTEVKVKAILAADATVEVEWQALTPQSEWVMPVYNGRESYIGLTENAVAGKIERDYLDSYLEPKNLATPARYRVLQLPEQRTTEYLEFPLGHVGKLEREKVGPYASMESSPYTAYAPITIELPTEKPAIAQVILCKDNWRFSRNCEIVRTLFSESVQLGNRLTVNLLEPVANTEVLLQVYLPRGTLTQPAFSKLLAYQLYHFWQFGSRPTWVYWSFTLSILVLSVIAVIVFIRFTRQLKEKKLAQNRAQKQQKQESAIVRSLRMHDPNFELEAFYRRGREIANRIQKSWSNGDMRDCRRFLSQGVYNRFRLQLKIMWELEKRRNVVADFKIKNFCVWAHNRSGEFDCLTVKLEAEARDIWVTVETPALVAERAAKSAPLSRFVEFYSFMRRTSATSGQEQPLNNCSHCGTPFPVEGETNKCKSCGAVMGSGEFDWVLTEITQESEYKSPRSAKKLAHGLSPDRLEDRASFIFWRDTMARLTGDTNYIRRDATEDYLNSSIQKQPLYDIAVGAVDTQSVEVAEHDAFARVLVKWSAADKKEKAPRHRRSLLSLRAKTEHIKHKGFDDPGCPACGAPLPETDSIECSYCHSPIQRQNADWLLEKVETTVE